MFIAHKVTALVGINQSYIAHLRNDGGGEIERQRGRHPKFFAYHKKKCFVTLVIEGRFGTALMTTKQFRFEIGELLYDITIRRVLRDARLLHKCSKGRHF